MTAQDAINIFINAMAGGLVTGFILALVFNTIFSGRRVG